MLPDWKGLTAEKKLEIMEPFRITGASATEMALLFDNATRNSVIGLLVRKKVPLMGKSFRPAPDPKERQRQQTQARMNRQRKTREEARPRVTPPVFRVVSEAPSARGVTLMELNSNTCRWPIGDVLKPGFHFCGAPPEKDKPYCAAHQRRSIKTIEA